MLSLILLFEPKYFPHHLIGLSLATKRHRLDVLLVLWINEPDDIDTAMGWAGLEFSRVT